MKIVLIDSVDLWGSILDKKLKTLGYYLTVLRSRPSKKLQLTLI